MMSPRNFSRACSMTSRVTCAQGAVERIGPSESYVVVHDPSKAVVVYVWAGGQDRVSRCARRGLRR